MSDGTTRSFLELRRQQAAREVDRLTDHFLQAASVEEIARGVLDQYLLTPPRLHVDNATTQKAPPERTRDAAPRDHLQVLLFVPCDGHSGHLELQADTFTVSPQRFDRVDGGIEVSLSLPISSPNLSNSKLERVLSDLKQQSDWVCRDFEAYNEDISHLIPQLIEAKKNTLEKERSLLDQLVVPLINKQSEPDVLVQPLVSKPPIKLQAPDLTAPRSDTAPILDGGAYVQIIEFIHMIGKRFETLPSTYSDREEEELRDLIITFLETQFTKGDSVSVTGETFNKTGKTDILVRHQTENIFAAECKFWQGRKGYLETIDQLLRYLTWRDSKAAIIIFDKNRRFINDLETIRLSTPQHPAYIEATNVSDLSRQEFRFRLNDDEQQAVTVTVLVFHYPPPSGS